ncbi:isocitrate lyase/phosphoenolpyruvate mutase family protein [Variovorax ginsengisoli]|uniref:Isocitrate lyase/phosphoenolpyruvate mutase family protein n=2 Tax=Variovorax ginsengisoli TaxID=363844 RepID=A0ABT8SBV0_9BURK|nr:isocitrate lyase/phosphoenolpyruvate mutase family protein [Variovorax ginsengisoli]MDN8617133.1 isocitrate lyase/phosphoenolpyruvate mutase family protein [Variovorax ginsengisoli]MDO1536303.1 isocitrate lyase/phosphoenolpyruvate mutase family protein [Variovorax ginsengisoli]
METLHPGTALRRKVEARRGLMVPGAANALAARVIEQLGFEAVYLSGAGLTNTFYGLPDLGFVGLADIAQHTAAIRDAVALPIIVDADTGFGNALNVRHSVRTLERAGANAIQLEDQASPKKCGHFEGKALVPTQEMAGKVRAAVDARLHPDFLVIARTDAATVEGIDAAIARAVAYAEAGADLTFVEAPESLDALRRIPREIACPQLVNVVIGGKTPTLAASDFSAMGFGMVLYANAALQGAVHGMQQALQALQRDGRLDESSGLVATFAERQALVRKSAFDALERRYA